MVVKYMLLMLLLLGSVLAQSDPSVSDAINSLPPELQGKVNEDQIKEIQNNATKLFKEKCERNGGPDSYLNAEKAYNEFTECLKGLVDASMLQKEVEEAKPNGQVDEVFKKYCGKKLQFKSCFRNLTEAVKPCFTVDERKNLKTVYNVSEQLAGFVCFKDGDRIALFIAEGGPECLTEKKEQIQECVNKTLGTQLDFDSKNMLTDTLPQISFGEKECKKMSEMQSCVVNALETCKQPTSANIVESLFKFVRQATPCKEFEEKEEGNTRSQKTAQAETKNKPGSASGLAVTSLTAVMAAVALTV